MPESSDKPTPEAKPAALPIARKPAGSNPVLPLPRSARAAGGAEPPSAPANPHISLSDLLTLAKTLSVTTVEPLEPDGERGVLSRQQRKFSRADTKPSRRDETDDADKLDDPAKAVDDPSPDPASALEAGEPLTLSTAPARETSLPSMTQRTRRSRPARTPGLLLLLAVLATCGVLVIAGCWVWNLMQPATAEPAPAPGRPAAPASQPATVQTVNAETSDLIDKIAEANKANDPARALALCVLLRSKGAAIPGLAFQEAQLAALTNDFSAANAAINRSLQANEEVSACYLLHATIIGRQGRPELLLRDCEAAVQADPFSPKAYFFLGEALRRAGRPRAALTRFDQAIARVNDAGTEDLYRFKQRLTLIEMDREAEFADELKNRLAQDPVPPNWLLTAAAQELHRGNYDAASSYLSRAAAAMPPEAFNTCLRDYYFYGFAFEPALAKVYAPVLAAPSPAHPATGAAASPAASPSPAAPALAAPAATPLNFPGSPAPAVSPAR